MLTYDQMFENAVLPADCQLVKELLNKKIKETKKTKSQSPFSSATEKKSSNYNSLFEDQPSLDDRREDYKPLTRILTYFVLEQSDISTLTNHLKVVERSEQFYYCCRPLAYLDLHKNSDYMQALLDDPQQSRTIKILLEEGLNKAITACLKNGNQEKYTMAHFFKSKLESEPLHIIVKNAASALNHHTKALSLSDSKAYLEAKPYFEKARTLLEISDQEWACVLEQGSWLKRSKTSPDHQTFQYFKHYMQSHGNSLEGASLTPKSKSASPTPTLYSKFHTSKTDDRQSLLAAEEESDEQSNQGASAY
ncbi:hypothetical protein PsalN5692_00319 [Piscirickettsia salmonis]|nr:hypothetical protein PsalN5692_00319 [Piscirickettsia salmonis]